MGKYSPHKQYERLNVSGSVLGWAARCVVCFCTSVVHRLLLCVPRRPTLALVEVQQLSLFSSLGKRHAHVRGAGAVRHHMSAVASLASCMAYAMAIVVRGGNSGTAVLRALILVLCREGRPRAKLAPLVRFCVGAVCFGPVELR